MLDFRILEMTLRPTLYYVRVHKKNYTFDYDTNICWSTQNLILGTRQEYPPAPNFRVPNDTFGVDVVFVIVFDSDAVSDYVVCVTSYVDVLRLH